MASIIKVDTIQDQDGNNIISEAANTITIGASGDTITIPSGATLANSGIVTGFQSTGIDDNATSTAITIDSSENVGIGTASPATKLDVSTGTNADGINISLFSNTQNTFSVLRLGHSLNNTIGTQTALTVSDGLGKIAFSGSDGTSFYDGATIEARSSQSFSGTQGGTYLQFYTTESGTKTLSERMRIDSSGNVGIGTSSPSCKLQTNYVSTTAYSTTISDGGGYLAGANDGLDIENGNSTVSNAFSSLHFRASGTAGNAAGRIILGNPGAANSFFAFQLRDSSHIGSTQEKMRIDSSGNVGIGTSSPQEKLDIDGNIAISGNTLFEEVTSTAGMPSSAGNKSVNTNYDSTFSLTAGKWLILVNASLQVFQTSSNESGLYLLSLSLGSSAGADDYGLIQKAVLKWGNGSNSYGDNSGGHFPTLTLGSTTTLHTRWTVTEYGTASNFWVRGNLTRIRCIRIG